MGIGFVVRNSQGEVLLAGAKKKHLVENSTDVEGVVMLWALECCKDCSVLVQEVE